MVKPLQQLHLANSRHNPTPAKLAIRFCHYTLKAYNTLMYTIIETPIFEKYAATVWSDDEREAFKLWIAQYPESGDVIPQSGRLTQSTLGY
jgi:hypothetical protein